MVTGKPALTCNMQVPLHEALSPISWLAGRWTTKEGQGKYPNIKDFQYHETLEFLCLGQPMFNFLSTSTHPEKGTPMHQERGFLRINPGTNNLAFMVSHNFGLTSLEEGNFNEETKEINLKSVDISRMSFAKSPCVTGINRIIKLAAADVLEVTLSMATETTPMTEHLKTIYKRSDLVS